MKLTAASRGSSSVMTPFRSVTAAEQQVADRWERTDARRNYNWALRLESQLFAYKGKAKGSKGEAKGKGKRTVPKAWDANVPR